MIPAPANPASAAARTGAGKHHKRLASDFSGNGPSARDIRAIFLTRRFGVRPPRLHLVPREPPPRPRLIDVRISVADGRSPYGRSRVFRLTHDDVDELIAATM